jgi:hypothetical protein
MIRHRPDKIKAFLRTGSTNAGSSKPASLM